MKKLFGIGFLVLAILPLFECSHSCGDEQTVQNNPVPTLTSISPTSKVSHMPSFTLTATGTHFISSSRIVFNGTEKQTTYVSATELTCQVDPDDITGRSAVTGDNNSKGLSESPGETIPVLVRNPSPGGGDSDSQDFTINSNHTFYGPRNISNNLRDSCRAAIAVDSAGNINVAWHDETPGRFNIYFSRSTDNGTSWSPALNISNNSGVSAFPAISLDSAGNINVAWTIITTAGAEIYFTRSTDNGNSWSSAVNISNSSGASWDTSIAVDSAGNINVAWHDDTPGNNDIYFSRSIDNGVTWSPAVNISNNSVDSCFPAMSVEGGKNINIAWNDNTLSGNYDIYFSRSTNNGANWSQGVNISNNSGNSFLPDIAVDSTGNIHVVWNDNAASENYDIYFSRSTDNGASWSQAVNISNNSKDSFLPAIAVDSAKNINVVWYDNIPGNCELYFSRSTDDGNNWSQALNISNNSGDSCYPAIELDSTGNVNVVWEGNTPGNYDIYFTSSTR